MSSLPALALRTTRVRFLLESRCNWIEPPRSQFATFPAVAGELATERERCRPCLGLGQINGRKGIEPCENCGGRGWYLVDSYTRARRPEPVRTGPMSGAERAVWRAVTDAAIASTRAFTDRPPEVHTAADLADVRPERWEVERDRHYRSGDYFALSVALEQLPPGAREIVVWTYEYGILNPTSRSEVALEWLTELMPDPIRVPHWLLPDNGGGQRRLERLRA